MANNVNFIFTAIDRFSSVARSISRSFGGLTDSIGSAASEIDEFDTRLSRALNRDALVRPSGALRAFGTSVTAGLTLPLGAAGLMALKQSAKFENLGIAFEVMIGDVEKAKTTLKELTDFAARTPFTVEEVMDASKVLLSFGVSADDVQDTVKRLGDMAAATGKPLKQFALVFGQIKAKVKLQAEEVMQFAEKGIALVPQLAAELSKITGETIEQSSQRVFKEMEKGNVRFKDFEHVFRKLTDEGGRFHNLTERMSMSLAGLTKQIQGSLMLALKEIGDNIVEATNLKDFLFDFNAGVRAFTASAKAFSESHPVMAKVLVMFGIFLSIIGPIIFAVGHLVIVIGALTVAATVLQISLAPILLLITLIAVAAFVIIKNWSELKFVWMLIVEKMRQPLADLALSIMIVFGRVRAFVDDTFSKINTGIAIMREGVSGVTGFFSGVGEKITGFFDFSSDINQTSKNQTDVNVNLKAPEGVIQSVKSQSTGKSPGLNLGVNMATSS